VFPSFDKGSSTASANFDDVGYLKLTVTLDDGAASPTVYYLGEPIAAFATTGRQYVSRFVPDHFDTELVANIDTTPTNLRTMDCAAASSVYPCGGNSSFTHSAQTSWSGSGYNGAATPALTKNYAGALASAITLQAMQLADRTKLDSNGAIKWSKEGPPLPAPAPTRFTFSDGSGRSPATAICLPMCSARPTFRSRSTCAPPMPTTSAPARVAARRRKRRCPWSAAACWSPRPWLADRAAAGGRHGAVLHAGRLCVQLSSERHQRG
jgi:hypothetical protein